MGDFTEKSVIKSAVRALAAPFADYASFSTVIQGVLTNNPWGCTAYESAGAAKPAVEKTKESYTASIVYQNEEAKTVGTITVRGPSMAAVNTAVTQITANEAITSAYGTGVFASRDSSGDSFSCTIKAHHSNGELYTVTFKRDSISLSSYEDDAIRTGLETWADSVAALA